ncbi:hypothetical protein ACOSQ3_031463 [Xanthoceras sorbifolium]
MADGVNFVAQRRRLRRERRSSRRKEAGSTGVSTSETIPVGQPTALDETPLRIQLLNGNAEIFGTELPPERWLTFPPRLKFANPGSGFDCLVYGFDLNPIPESAND